MPIAEIFRAEPQFAALGPEFSDPVEPAAFPDARLRFRNDRIAARVGLDTLDDAEWLDAFARFQPLPGAQPAPLAMRYHGHQFRSYNPDLGDGRGFLFAQLREAGSGRLLDLGTKGSGQTPWSRTADGRLTLKGGVREVLATEMLEALGAPTSKSLSLVETGEQLSRHDEPSPTRGAVLTRLSHSHIRFGTFQRLAYFDRPDLMAQLVDHVAALYAPEAVGEDVGARAATLLAGVTRKAARLAAAWTAAGFVHGVLNTDNMNITGESFDYGPYRFLPRYDPAFTAAYFDEYGLYAFGRQAEAVHWNLQQLAGALTQVADPEALTEALNLYGPAWQAELRAAFLTRLGVASRSREDDGALVSAFLAFAAVRAEDVRWEPLFFDWFGGGLSSSRALSGPRSGVYRGELFETFRDRLMAFEPVRPERLGQPCFQAPEPEELLYDQIEAIWAPIAGDDDWTAFNAKIAAIGRMREAWEIAVP